MPLHLHLPPPHPTPLLRVLLPHLSSHTLPSLTPHRLASHAAQGSKSQKKNGPGARLGAKKGATELVVPGNIIFRQRGTHWFPGEGCGMGRDHTIFAREKGYVVYYSSFAEQRKGRKYIGVVAQRGMTLPRAPNQPRHRTLGLYSRVMLSSSHPQSLQEDDSATASSDPHTQPRRPIPTSPTSAAAIAVRNAIPTRRMLGRRRFLRRETYWDIGRVNEGKKVKIKRLKLGKKEERRARRTTKAAPKLGKWGKG